MIRLCKFGINLFYLILSTYFSLSVYANETTMESCAFKNLNDRLGPIRDQSDMGWCFANTAADLLSYAHWNEIESHLNSQNQLMSLSPIAPAGSEHQVSAIYTALNYQWAQIKSNIKPEEIFSSGGLIYETLNIIQEKGFFCPQSLDYSLLNTGFKTKLREKFNRFSEIHENYQKYISTKNENFKAQYVKMIKELESQGTFLSNYDKKKIQSVLEEPLIHNAVLKLTEVVCEDRKIGISKRKKFNRLASYRNSTEEFYNEELHQKITQNEVLNIIDKVLDNEKPLGISYLLQNVINSEMSNTIEHASIISGRKFTNNTCYYQIRNSWGTDCHRKAFINSVYIPDYPIYKYECEGGTFWVPRKDLPRILLEVFHEDLLSP
ncbi:MAG: hypothetical protein J0M15_14275 [Deltaproteobacteria bacterium]|nr:hypothetical protein [Deltaproteobacteria bacterium]